MSANPQEQIVQSLRYTPEYCELAEDPSLGWGWRVNDSFDGMKIVLGEDFKCLRKIDAEMACKSLNEAEANGEHFEDEDLTDERFGYLLTRYFQW